MQIEAQKKYRLFLIVLVYLIIALLGFIIQADINKIESHAYLIYFIFALVLTHITIVDSRITGKPLPFSVYWLVFILYGIAVPICILRAHGIKKGLKTILLHLIGFLLVLFTTGLISNLIFYDRIMY